MAVRWRCVAVFCVSLVVTASSVSGNSVCSVLLDGQFLASSFSASTVAQSTRGGNKSDVIVPGRQFALICIVNVTDGGMPTFSWRLNASTTPVNVRTGEACGVSGSTFRVATRVRNNTWNATLAFCNAERANAGLYTLFNATAGGSLVDSIVLYAPPLVAVSPTNSEVMLEKTVSISCSFAAFPPATIVWLKNGKEINETRFSVTASVEPSSGVLSTTRSVLTLTKAMYSDRDAQYTCQGTNTRFDNGSVIDAVRSGNFLIRVRDPLGPLWPILGIFAQIAIVVAIIVYDSWKNGTLIGMHTEPISYSDILKEESHAGLLDNASQSDSSLNKADSIRRTLSRHSGNEGLKKCAEKSEEVDGAP